MVGLKSRPKDREECFCFYILLLISLWLHKARAQKIQEITALDQNDVDNEQANKFLECLQSCTA